MTTDFNEALEQAARSVRASSSVDEHLSNIVETAKDALPGFDAVGISTVDKDGHVTTRVGTGELVWELDRLQYELGQGPCLDSLQDTSDAWVVEAPRLEQDMRWPEYVPRAVALGLRSQLGIKLYLDSEGTVGGLNVYSTTTEDIDPGAISLGRLFASHAAIALGFTTEISGLQEALASRTVIGTAVGMVMQQYHLSQDAAFGLLVRASSHSNTKIRDIAQRMVDDANKESTR